MSNPTVPFLVRKAFGCDEDAAGSKPEPSTNTSHLSFKMFHSSGVIPVSILGLSSLGPVAGGFAVWCGVSAVKRTHAMASLQFVVS